MAEITLTASMRSNLLSLKNTTDLMNTTQNRLSTGLKVNSAIDNPSSYYTAQSLNNRANDLSSLMDSMTQGIQTIKAANEGIESITSLVEQAKSIANSARDTTDLEEREKYQDRLNDIRSKIDDLAKDSNYKGINLIYNTGTQAEADTLKVRFNEYMGDNGTFIEVHGVNLVSGTTDEDGNIEYGLGLNAAEKWGTDAELSAEKGAEETGLYTLQEDAATGGSTMATGKKYYIKNADGSYTYYGDGDDAATIPNGDGKTYVSLTETAVTYDDLAADTDLTGVYYSGDAATGYTKANTSDAKAEINSAKISSSNESIDETLIQIETAISKLREVASDLGSSYSVIETRQEFTENLINVLTEGADDLTLADMNEESANMLALQTRQQLAINALSLSSQASQAVLNLF